MVGVEPWAEIRRLHFVRGLSMNPNRGPLLIISGAKDHTVAWSIANASYKKQRRNGGHDRDQEEALAFVKRFV